MATYAAHHPRDAAWAFRTALVAAARPLPEPTLVRVAPQLLRPKVRPHPLDASDATVTPIVLYLTGTGETPEALVESLSPLRSAIPALAGAQEYVFDAPFCKDAYDGPTQFAESAWTVIEPLTAGSPGPFILIGMSRGAVLALDLAGRIASSQGKVATVLALSPPMAVPSTLPRLVLTIARMEALLEGVHACVATEPEWLRNVAEAGVRQSQIFLTAMVLKSLGILDERELAFVIRSINEHGALQSSLRSSREFRLLRETAT